MEVDSATAVSATYKGKTYYFCNPSCLEQFKANPARFLADAPADRRLPAGMLGHHGDALEAVAGAAAVAERLQERRHLVALGDEHRYTV